MPPLLQRGHNKKLIKENMNYGKIKKGIHPKKLQTN